MAKFALGAKLSNSFGQALRYRNFRIYYGGSLISPIGTWMQGTAQAWLVLQITNSPIALATVTSLQFLPIMLLSLIGGAVADRFPRRRLMVITQLLATAQALLLGALVLTGTISIWHIYVMAITLGLINALDAPLRQSFVSELVPLEILPNAIALVATGQNLGRILGPALGGITLATLGVDAAFFINAATFAASLGALWLIDWRQLIPIQKAPRRGVLGQVGESLAYAYRTPPILFLLIGTAFIGVFGQNFTTMVPLVSDYLVHASPAQFGLLNSCLGCGSFGSALFLTSRGAPSTRRILIAGTCFGLALMAISLSHELLVSCALFVVVGAAAVTYSASVNTSLQMQAPPEMRGRFAAMISLLIGGTSPIGALITGGIATAAGVWACIMANGIMCALGMVIAYLYLRQVRGTTVFDLGKAGVSRAAHVTAPIAANELAIEGKRDAVA